MAKKRRSYGKGNIAKRPSGRWQARIRVAGRFISRTCDTKAEAAEWLAVMKPVKAEGDLYGPALVGSRPHVTYAEAAPDLFAYFKAGQRRVYTESTLRGYRSEVGSVLEFWGGREIAKTTESGIARWVSSLREAGRATSTIRNRLNRLSQLHKLAVREGWILQVPCEVHLPRQVQRTEREAISEPALEKLIEAAEASQDKRLLAVVLLAASAGLRRGEIPRLQGQDIDLRERNGAFGWIKVAVRSDTDRTKSGRGREVPILTAELLSALKALFPAKGSPLIANVDSASGLTKLANRLWKSAGLGKYSQLHTLRHRWVTWVLENNELPVKLQQWAGHRDLATTMRYSHTAPDPSSSLMESIKCERNVSGGKKRKRRKGV